MTAKTTHFEFYVPTDEDAADISEISANFTALDAALYDLTNHTVNATDDTNANAQGAGAIKTAGGIYAAQDIRASRVYNAVWNDYAEYRRGVPTDGGWCLAEYPDGLMRRTHERMMPGCRMSSDTFGHCMGETEEAKTPIAVAGRVLAYPYRDRCKYKLGDAVCSAPGGKVDRMSRLERILYPERIVGVVSEIPDYEMWEGKVPVNGRIWIYVR